MSYENWMQQNNGGKGWEIKYYKGLGTSTSKEAKAYFSQLSKHRVQFFYKDDKYAEDDEAIDMSMAGARANDRKRWMND